MAEHQGQPEQIAFIGSSVPRRCGIAEFAGDLCNGILAAGNGSAENGTVISQVAVTDAEGGYAYPPRVRFDMPERDIASYRRAAEYLNINQFSMACLQHEYGLYGGLAGSHILALLRDLRMPVVTTMHTILRQPTPQQVKVTQELARLSDRLVVMSHHGVEFLQEIYKVPSEKIDLIPHGVPDVPFVDPSFYKDRFGVEGKVVILTFGLLGPDKGIEYVIEALPAILARHPNVAYLIVGATHPALIRQHGEAYRVSLERLAQDRSVAGNVMFHNRYVSKEELIEFLCAADLYVTPYLNPEQITSGTLSYAAGIGKAIISTPYWHAQELLAEGRGMLVPFKDSGAVARSALELLDNETERHAMRKRAYLLGREMIWAQVAKQYLQSFERARQEHVSRGKTVFAFRPLGQRPRELPTLNLDHLRRMTDHTGLLEHAVFTVPNYTEGYSADDNARALILTTLLEEITQFGVRQIGDLATRYVAFLWSAFDPANKCFRNHMAYDGRWVADEPFSADCHARVLWALGTVLGHSQDRGLRGIAGQLFDQALAPAMEFAPPRSWAFTLLGIHEYLRRFFGARTAQGARETLAGRLLECFQRTSGPDWMWFENDLSYDNAKLPHALILSGRWMGRADMLEAGLASLRWLCGVQKAPEGHFVPIGSDGFWKRGGPRARYSQQPLEAHATVSACLEAYRTTQDEQWLKEAQCAFDWFLGRNDVLLPLYDPVTGGCQDGLWSDHVNDNQGAESTLAFLLSLVEMRLAESFINE